MANPLGARSLELEVSNFGPIAEARIELRPLSVFVGPSNTGKSYMASLIYALHRFFGGSYRNIDFLRFRGEPFVRFEMLPPDEYDLSENNIDELLKWSGEALTRVDKLEDSPESSLELPVAIAELVRPVLNNVAHLNEELDNELARCFGVERAKNLVRYPHKGATGFSLRGIASAAAGSSAEFGYRVGVTENGAELDASIPRTMPLLIGQEIAARHHPWRWLVKELSIKDERRGDIALELISKLADEIASRNIDPLSRPAYYLPADRAGVMHAHQVVVRALIASASRAALRPDSPMPVLSGVLGDFLEQLVMLASIPQEAHNTFEELALLVENTLLRGSVRVERSQQIDYPSFVYRPSGWERDLPLMNASSMVSELAPVVLYLRQVVRPGNLLIIEEPEAHLHPEMQAAFTRLLVSAVQSGIRILITTHSEWILEELANLVRLSDLPINRRGGIKDKEMALSPDQLGAWFFEPNEKEGASVVREITLDEESATFPAGYGLIAESLYNRWVEISTRIQEE